ncbi:putative UDP-N-acetylglucosamine pyrophosphorylase [Bisporella sp. PMI_857]|nr:putative UDP-N-acetylglucosamine pyrophosphorylase [Bisporella sp. PMI_857]
METVKKALNTLHIGSGGEMAAPPKEPTKQQLEELREEYTKAQQEQVFAFYDELSVAEKAALYSQLSDINPDRINIITDRALNPPKPRDDENDKVSALSPLPESATASILDSKQEDIEKWYQSGLNLIAENKVAVVLMAGGQGTRLGSSDPKGCFNIGLPSGKSLFKIQAERIRKIQRLAHKKGREDVVVPWYVMTSGPTRKPTETYFKENGYFGLREENVIIFEQGVLPCISNDGKILLESKGKVAVAPDGNGGIYEAIVKSSVMGDLRKRGIEHIHAYCVDNCLVKVADPVFIGFAASKDVDIATKVVRKRSATESVGLILLKNGKPDVVEYSEIDKETAEAKDEKQHDVLKFRAANIVNHYYSFRFLESIPDWAHKLPHHVARKKIPYVDTEKGSTIKPEKPNGIKLEQFVFDVFPMLELNKFACLEVKREDEFSPLKNARGTGEDDPDTSRKDIMNQGERWASAAGAVVVSEGDNNGIEISPLVSYGGEGLEDLKGKTITAPAVLEKEWSE